MGADYTRAQLAPCTGVGARATDAKSCASLFPFLLPAVLAEPEIIPEPVDLMHTLVQDGHDADVAVCEMAPVNKMAFIAEEETIDAEFSWDRFRDDTMRNNPVERGKKAGDVSFCLLVAPSVPRVPVDVIETK